MFSTPAGTRKQAYTFDHSFADTIPRVDPEYCSVPRRATDA